MKPSEDFGEYVLYVQRGSYLRTIPVREGGRSISTTIRPSVEDVLVFESDTNLLRIKTESVADKENYIRLVARHLFFEERLAEEAIRAQVFNLAPIAEETFDYGGSGAITGVDLVKVRMRVYGSSNCQIEVKARKVTNAFAHDLSGLSFRSGILLSARLRFYVHLTGKRRTQVTFDITPPARTDLPDRDYSDLVLAYLRQQGVKVR